MMGNMKKTIRLSKKASQNSKKKQTRRRVRRVCIFPERKRRKNNTFSQEEVANLKVCKSAKQTALAKLKFWQCAIRPENLWFSDFRSFFLTHRKSADFRWNHKNSAIAKQFRGLAGFTETRQHSLKVSKILFWHAKRPQSRTPRLSKNLTPNSRKKSGSATWAVSPYFPGV